ncbi:MAG: Universal stress protein UspA and related nucleotide-binding proteins [uncultured Acetobacteraceae bacterium]|jgi:nucleotide-binding universal stress UspA family protein|uniref:Universal stress protein UspA and related nucleotide-binding proteins n=1 Tax=uncultured Acetobacteraceae bacterium TaxID=169975 RepID=A0A6J4IMM6_9PROT|nr:MAG: Universal stress protein UspA and related nucleotide-binding proteins [uncultured Acetobacteraceae bacterium]
MPSDAGTTEGATARADAARDRVFLVVVDDSPERAVALKYACLRARKSGGRVALLRVIEPAGQTEWAGVGAMLQEEGREEAERLLSGLAAQVNEITGGLPILLIREGDPRDELLALIAEDPRISILVLAAAASGSGPGPLIVALTGRYAGRVTVPMTIVPGAMDDDALDRVT